jgi:hypothetical protein
MGADLRGSILLVLTVPAIAYGHAPWMCPAPVNAGAHGSGGGRSPARLAARITSRSDPRSASGPRMLYSAASPYVRHTLRRTHTQTGAPDNHIYPALDDPAPVDGPSPAPTPSSPCAAARPAASGKPSATGPALRQGPPDQPHTEDDLDYLQIDAHPSEIPAPQRPPAHPHVRHPAPPPPTTHGSWLNGGVPPVQVAEWAGHSVAVLLKVYAKCIDGQDQIAKRRIEDALRDPDDPGGDG